MGANAAKTGVSKEVIKRVAEAVRQVKPNPEFYNRPFLHLNADRETRLRVYFLSAAICHQTRTLHHPQLNLWGWDYMEHVFTDMVENRHPLLIPGYSSCIEKSEIEWMLASLFSVDRRPENTTLDRLSERAEMIFQICTVARNHYDGSISRLVDASGGLLYNNGKGLYEVLGAFSAFSDPHRKKATFYIKLACDAGVLNIRDPENLIPVMDYHMMRVLLRTGMVEVYDGDLSRSLKNRDRLESDEEVRSSAIEAMRLLAEQSGWELLSLNDLFWPLGRSCCFEEPVCVSGKCSKDPCTLTKTTTAGPHKSCILQESCRGAREEEYRNLWEPMTETNYY
ncbi:MAG: hypothetical protein Kow00127_10920 [Bacteroidales bacterium]